jgi:hypothetical protein
MQLSWNSLFLFISIVPKKHVQKQPYDGRRFMRSKNATSSFTFSPAGKLFLHYVRSSGTHPLHEMRQHFKWIMLRIIKYNESAEIKNMYIPHPHSLLLLHSWLGFPSVFILPSWPPDNLIHNLWWPHVHTLFHWNCSLIAQLQFYHSSPDALQYDSV